MPFLNPPSAPLFQREAVKKFASCMRKTLPWTWYGFPISHSLNFFTASGGNGGISADALLNGEMLRNMAAFFKRLKGYSK